MLVLKRKTGERVLIGEDVVVTVLEVRGDRVKLGFEGPPEIPIHREELAKRIAEELAKQLVVEPVPVLASKAGSLPVPQTTA